MTAINNARTATATATASVANSISYKQLQAFIKLLGRSGVDLDFFGEVEVTDAHRELVVLAFQREQALDEANAFKRGREFTPFVPSDMDDFIEARAHYFAWGEALYERGMTDEGVKAALDYAWARKSKGSMSNQQKLNGVRKKHGAESARYLKARASFAAKLIELSGLNIEAPVYEAPKAAPKPEPKAAPKPEPVAVDTLAAVGIGAAKPARPAKAPVVDNVTVQRMALLRQAGFSAAEILEAMGL